MFFALNSLKTGLKSFSSDWLTVAYTYGVVGIFYAFNSLGC